MKRLCEVEAELREPVLELGMREPDGYKTVRQWASLRCPRAGHCDPTRKCEGLTPANLVTIARIEDTLFVKGFVRGDELWQK